MTSKLTTALLCVVITLQAHSLHAKDKIKIEIVDTASALEFGAIPSTVQATPAQSVTHCSGVSGIYARVYGYDCTTTSYPASPAHVEKRPYLSSSYYARAIMPDGSHVWLQCDLGAKHCGPIDPWDKAKTKESCDYPSSATPVFLQVCLHTSESKSLGFYEAKLDSDKVVIYGPKGKREYSVLRSWGSW
jgi:hypothetical protein